MTVGCSVAPQRRGGDDVAGSSLEEAPSPADAQPMLWEVWPRFKTLSGQPLTNRNLLYGDELRESGRNNTALDEYLKGSRAKLSEPEEEAAALRVSSQYLLLDKPTKALSVVGSYYRKRGLSEAAVSPEFGLLLAFGFGREGDSGQALAWFARVIQQPDASPSVANAARQGARLLLASLSSEAFEATAAKWHSDQIINGIIGQERARRASAGWVEPDPKSRTPFWAAYDPHSGALSESSIDSVVGSEAKVGVILSLTKYGAVGPDMKKGIELAAAAQAQLPKVRLEIRDVGTDAADSSAVIRELVAGPKVNAVVGPLGVTAAQTARDVGVPMLSLSKTEPFTVGGGIFRLGVTTTSQVEALVNAAYGDYKITRFAVVHPQTATGMEFLEALRTKLAALNLQLVLEVAYTTSDDVSLMEAAQRVESANAEAVLLPDSIDVSARFLSHLSPETRKKIRALGTAGWDNPDKIANSQALFNRAIFVAPFFKNSTRPVVQDFVASYRGKFNSAPSAHSAQGFDAETVLNSALSRSFEKKVSLQEALSQLPQYDGVTGVITADGGSGELRRSLYVVEVGPTMFQEKLPPQQVQRYEEAIAMRGNDVISPDDETSPLEADQKVSSGY